MSTQSKFGNRAEAIQAGWASRRHQNLSSRDTAVSAHLKQQWDSLPIEWRSRKLPVGVRQAEVKSA
jgi:hypothetical protein